MWFDQWLLETRFNHHATDGTGLVYLNFTRQDSLTSLNPRLIGTYNQIKFILGYDGQLTHYQLKNRHVNAKTDAQQHDFYLQTTFTLTPKLALILGGRKAWQSNRIRAELKDTSHPYNQVGVTEQGIAFRPIQEVVISLRRDGNFSFPKANEETWLPDNVKSLKVQTGTSYEMNAQWKTEKHQSQFNLYRLQLNHEIAFDPSQTADQPFGAFNNLDQTLRYGLSLSHQFHLTSRATINGQVNYVNARFASGPFKGNFIPAVPAINANAGFLYDWTDHWAMQYTLLYTGSRYASEDIQNIGKKVWGYWLNDVALQYFIKSFIFSFEVHNIFNKQIANYAFYDAFTQQNSYYPAPLRNYLFTVKINID